MIVWSHHHGLGLAAHDENGTLLAHIETVRTPKKLHPRYRLTPYAEGRYPKRARSFKTCESAKQAVRQEFG